MKDNPRLKNTLYTENLLMCSSVLCGCISRVIIDNPDLAERLSKESCIIPAYKAMRDSIDRIIEDNTEIPDENQLKLEL